MNRKSIREICGANGISPRERLPSLRAIGEALCMNLFKPGGTTGPRYRSIGKSARSSQHISRKRHPVGKRQRYTLRAPSSELLRENENSGMVASNFRPTNICCHCALRLRRWGTSTRVLTIIVSPYAPPNLCHTIETRPRTKCYFLKLDENPRDAIQVG